MHAAAEISHDLAVDAGLRDGFADRDGAEPYAGKEWTDSGENRDRRQFEQREIGESRPVPCPPELTGMIRAHIREFGVGPDGRTFVGERNGREMPKLTIVRA
nr:hypothetical protein GCM10020063_075470 [Dactylosporangium thailandense]